MSSLIRSVIHNWHNIRKNAVILDTETTGLDSMSEICEISIIDAKGTVLLDTLVQPFNDIPAEATRIHGISNEDVKSAPTIDQLYNQLRHICLHRNVVTYNKDFDKRLIDQSLRAHSLQTTSNWTCQWYCAMESYADFKKTPRSSSSDGYKWHKLSAAAEQLGIDIPSALHRSLPDTQLTLSVINESYLQLTTPVEESAL